MSKVGWAMNWAHNTSPLPASMEYVPMLWNVDNNHLGNWMNEVPKLISSGSRHLLAFNEPDHAGQANMSPESAAEAYKTYMQPWAGQARLGAPAVTNGPAPMGMAWLRNFMNACSGCTFDFVPVHWYDSATNIAYFKNYLTDAHAQTGKPIWLTEFGAAGTDAQVQSFLREAMAWMDSQPWIERYSYFMCATGSGMLLSSSNTLSGIGSTFATA